MIADLYILISFMLKLTAGLGIGGGGRKKGPSHQGEALRQMLSQHMVRISVYHFNWILFPKENVKY